jgi:hypothetical protein
MGAYESVSSAITVSSDTISDFFYTPGGATQSKLLTVSGLYLSDDILITAPADYEISTSEASGFQSTPITLSQTGGMVSATSIYIRLKAGLSVGTYNGETLVLSSVGTPTKTVICNGAVLAPVLTTSVSSLSGMVYYPAGAGPSNETSFTVSGYVTTNVTVTAPADYEISTGSGASFVATSPVTLVPVEGVLAPDTIYVRIKSGLALNTYVEDVLLSASGATTQHVTCNGIVKPAPTIYISTTALTGMDYLVGNGPSAEQSFTVSGSNLFGNVTIVPQDGYYQISTGTGASFAARNPITLVPVNGELDSTTIYVRLISGLVGTTYVKNVVLTSPSATTQNVSCTGTVLNPPSITTSNGTLEGFEYTQGKGPANDQYFEVFGYMLTENVTITAPTDYEISTTSGASFVATNPITLVPTSGSLSSTYIYARLKSGLAIGSYSENIVMTSSGVTRNVACNGSVNDGTGCNRVLIESDFTGTTPSLFTPWTNTSTLDSIIDLTQGWSYNPAGMAGSSTDNNAFVVSQTTPASLVYDTLLTALTQNQYVSLIISPSTGPINLNRAKITFAIKRIGRVSAPNYAVFTNKLPYAQGNEIFTGTVPSIGLNTVLTCYLPGTGFDSITQPFEIRIYPYNGQRYDPKISLTAFKLQSGDLILPTTPQSLTASSGNSYSIDLTWNASTDNVGISGYNIYNNGVFLAFTSYTHYSVGVLSAGTSQSFTVRSRDMSGNESTDSNQATATTASTTSSPNERSPLGMNLTSPNDRMREHPFINLVKYSRPWGMVDRPFDAYDGINGRPTASEMVDANGYLKAGKAGSLVVISNGEPLVYPATGADYVCRYEGEGTVEIVRRSTHIPVSGGRAQFTIPSGCTDMLELHVTSNSSTNPIRNLWISELEYESYYNDQTNPDKMFYPEFLASWSQFKNLRFMDWMDTNWSPITAWQDSVGDYNPVTAPKESNCSWGTDVKGVPVEVMVKLANKLNVDPWFCMPHGATDSYITSFANYVKTHLSPSNKVYIEYSNECWNWMFSQAGYCMKKGSGIWGTADGEAYRKYYALRSVQMFKLWETVFDNNTFRLVRALAWQAAGVNNTILDLQCSEYSGKAYTHADAIAIAPYFAGTLDGYNSPALNMSVSQILDYCQNFVDTTCVNWISAYSKAAIARNLNLIAYEGGQHLVAYGADKDAVKDSTNLLVDKFTQANDSGRMKDIYLSYFNVWKNNGGKMFSCFSSTGGDGSSGHWGARHYEGQPRAEAPKYDAMLTFIEQNDL